MHSEKVGAFRANKSQKGGLFLRHIPVLLYFNMGVHSGDCSRCLKGDGGGVQTPLKVLGNSKFIGLSLYHV